MSHSNFTPVRKLTRTEMQRVLTQYEADRRQLLRQHGTGVRPSWVSTDLALLDERIARLRDIVGANEGGPANGAQ